VVGGVVVARRRRNGRRRKSGEEEKEVEDEGKSIDLMMANVCFAPLFVMVWGECGSKDQW